VRSLNTPVPPEDTLSRAAATKRSLLRRHWRYAALVLLGLGIRLLFLPYLGTHDIDTILSWGRDVIDVGLPHAYTGIYFPVEWQLSTAAVHASREFDVSGIASLKAITLSFDLGAVALLGLLLRTWRLDGSYALIYWVHPYFVLLLILGYVDAHVGFSVLACLLILARWPGPRGFLAAGFPLALAFMMKPQAIVLLAAIPILVLLAVLLNPARRRENLQPLLLLIAPLAIFAAYSLYFDRSGAGLLTIADTYTPSELARQSPSLTARMTNIWYPVALALREDGAPIWTVTEPTVLNSISQLAAIVALIGSLAVLARARAVIGSREVLFAFLFAALIVPMIATHAHENHLYLALLLSIPVAAGRADRRLMWPLQGLLAAQFLNLLGVYGLGDNELTRPLSGLQDLYGYDASQLFVVAATIVFWCWLAVEALRSVRRPADPDYEHLLAQRAYRQA
jgi:hypothetical protein